jgi:predicted RND superfamily exporter protein
MDIIKEKIFHWIAIFSYAHCHHLILGTLFLGGLSGFLITGLQFQSDVVNFLPSNAPTTGAFVKFPKEFKSGDSLFIVMESKSGGEKVVAKIEGILKMLRISKKFFG